mgnify:CR=1 FL=1
MVIIYGKKNIYNCNNNNTQSDNNCQNNNMVIIKENYIMIGYLVCDCIYHYMIEYLVSIYYILQ